MERKNLLDQLNTEMGTLESQLAEAAALQKELEVRKGELETEERKSETTIAEYRTWIEDHEKSLSADRSTLMEAMNTLTAINNAWMAVKQCEDISKVITSSADLGLLAGEFNSFSDLEAWFQKMGEQISTLVEAYREMYSRVIGVITKGGVQ